MASPRPDISPKSAAYPTINGQIRVGFYQDTVSNKSSPDKSCSPRENPQQSPYPHYSEHVYTPNTTENAYYNYANSPYYTHAPNYSQRFLSRFPFPERPPTKLADAPDHSQPSPGVYSQHSPTVPPQHSPNIHAPNSPMMQVQLSPSVQTQNSPVMQQHSPNLLMPSPGLPAEKTPNVVLPEQSSVLQCSPELEAFQAPEDQDKMTEKLLQQQPQSAVFPVKKRAYNDGDLPQINKQRYEIAPMLTQQLEMKRNAQINHQASLVAAAEKKEPESKQYVHQNIPDPKTMNVQPGSAQPSPTPTHRENYPRCLVLSLVRTQQAKIDLSKYTNMGYSGPDVNYTRALQQFGRTDLNYTATSAPNSQKLATQPALTTPSSTGDMSMRYGDPNVALQQMSYKGMELGCASTQAPRATSDASSDAMSDRLSQIQEASSGSNVARYNDVGRSMASLSHIVDRFGSEERMMAGLQQNTPSYYSDKGLGTAHIFNKPISTSASALPIFSQSNMAAMQSYSQNVQATTTSMYNRQMSELQNAAVMQNDLKASQQVQEKKSKKRKSSKNESQQQSAAANQGFQSYAGLKGTASIEPSAISLKTSSVVPGSAFNFGPTPTGLGLGTGLYAAADKDAYPNFLDEFRSAAPNYYMAAAAAAAHHRATPETGVDKQTRPAHQSSNPQSAAAAAAAYPFLGAPQATRSSYPIGSPFMPNAQAQLMDTTSPLYQHYLQAGVLNQGLLGPPGAYPPGYHPALSMRQPYESMTRPPWL
ncbi:hypothetical protein JTB14_006232 [Gonioctena quinquepunctata]|nr:hypothetical protein JTB14_006232 [Gonioctena quinquepunctata]